MPHLTKDRAVDVHVPVLLSGLLLAVERERERERRGAGFERGREEMGVGVGVMGKEWKREREGGREMGLEK